MRSINLITPINSLGYGTVGFHIAKELAAYMQVNLWPQGQISYPMQPKDANIINSLVANQAFYDDSANCLKIWHQFDMAQMVGRGLHIGMPIFELDKFTEREKHHLSKLDIIFVCSHWAKRVVHDQLPATVTSLDNVLVTPLGVDTTVFCPLPLNPGPTRFLNIGKWEIRKGHDVLIEAFLKAFTAEDNVELLMMNHNPFLTVQQTEEWHRLYKNHYLGNKVHIIPRKQTQVEVAELMQFADCGIFPARAEGWNLEALEMMACGRPVILTNYSAHTEFATIDNSMLIPYHRVEDAWDGIWFNGQGNWMALGEVEIEVMAEYMREIHSRKQRGELKLNESGVETAKGFTWKNTVRNMLNYL